MYRSSSDKNFQNICDSIGAYYECEVSDVAGGLAPAGDERLQISLSLPLRREFPSSGERGPSLRWRMDGYRYNFVRSRALAASKDAAFRRVVTALRNTVPMKYSPIRCGC